MDMDGSVWLLPLLTALTLGLAVGGLLAWLLGRRIDPMNPPEEPSVLARTARWLGIAAAVGVIAGLGAFPTFFGTMVSGSPNIDPGIFLVPSLIPALLAYAATTSVIVMSVTALARRDRSGAAWTGLVVSVLTFLPWTAFTVAIISFGYEAVFGFLFP